MNQKIFISQINTKNDLPVYDQETINKLFIKYFVTAACVQRKPKTKEEANDILKEVQAQYNKYTVKSKYVASRKVALLAKEWFENLSEDKLEFPDIFSNFYEKIEGQSINIKMEFYEKMMLDYLRKYITTATDEIILVSSTGACSPNPVQTFISEKGWNTGISTCMFSDCYANIIAVKNASGMLFNPALPNVKNVAVVHSELQSIHVNVGDFSPQNLVITSLFGDGFVNYKISKNATKGIEVKFIKEKIIPNSTEHMKWQLGERIFKMSLSVMVPHLLYENIDPFVTELAADYKVEKQDLIENSIWAIHPGGPKIVEMVSQQLNLKPEQTIYSYEVLKENGNMSSVTLPYIWEKILEDTTVPSGKRIVSMAFGPGLTACAMIGEKV